MTIGVSGAHVKSLQSLVPVARRNMRETMIGLTIILLLCTAFGSTGHRLNVPRVLLPVFNDFAVNFTLEVSDGACYQWSLSRPDIIQLIPINEDFEGVCSSAIMIQTITREPTRNTAIVLAEDVNTGQFLRCDIIVDTIASLKLVTTTRELYIEEAPEAFEVRAYDEQGNEFSTLAGVEFLWSIGTAHKHMSFDTKSPSDVLRFITYAESQYETPPTVAGLDSAGKKGHIVLLEGAKTGTAQVSVKLPSPEYRHVPTIDVELIVIANLIIIPSDITIMEFDSFKYRIMQVRQGRLEEIQLPSMQYYLEAEHPDILQIRNEDAVAYSHTLGRTKVLLHDKNVRDEYPVILPSATVNVNEVAYITIAVLPNRNSGLILGHLHEIVVELYNSKDHKFHIGDGVEVKMELEDNYFDIKSVSKNGTYAVGVPILCGTMTVEAKLYAIIDKYGRRVPLSNQPYTKADFQIHTPVTVQPHILALPWDAKIKPRNDIVLKASGGDGSYVWSSKQQSIVTVSQNGTVRILSMGSTEVSVAMTRNQFNRDTTKVHVLPPSKLEIVKYNMEAAVGEPIYLHIALYGKLINGTDLNEVPFSDCQDINFETYIPDGNLVQSRSKAVQPAGIACAVIAVTSLDVGTSEVTVAYNANNQFLADNVTVFAYEPLVVIHPSSKETLLAVGTSRKIVFKGGPHPLSKKPQYYQQKMENSNKNIVEVLEHKKSPNDPNNLSVYEVLCKVLGEATLTYTVSNIPVLPNCKDTVASETVTVICGKPRFIYLQPEFKDSKQCPISLNADRVMADSNKSLKTAIIVKDANARVFDNITSLMIDWNIKPSAIGAVEASQFWEETETDMGVVLPKSHYQNVVFKKHFGTLTLSAVVSGYQKYILNKLSITPEWPPFPEETTRGTIETPVIKASIEMVLVTDTTINPKKLMILNDPSTKYYLQVSQGSGYYEFVLSANDIADVRYIESTKAISITPKKAGTLHISLVDLCLPFEPAEAVVEVQELAVIEVETVNEIEKGKCAVAMLKLYDTNGQIIKLPSLNALEFKTEIDNDCIEVKPLPASEHGVAPYDHLLFMVYGLSEGESQLTFVNKAEDREIQVKSVNIQVFLPLTIFPKNLTMLVGTVYQVETLGGPSKADLEFSTENSDTLHTDRKGILEGKSVGQTRVIVRAVGLNSKGNKIVYSEDHADIQVLHLEGIKIVVPTNRVKMGATFPIWAFGIPQYLTPLVIGSMQLPLIFMWSSSDSNLLTLHNMYEGTGINIRYQNEVSLRAKAINPGVATISLNVTMPCNTLAGFKNDVVYSASVKVAIFEELRLTNPSFPSNMPLILMSPNSVIKLQTNHDKHGSTSYKVLSSLHGGDVEESSALTPAFKSVTVDKNGLVRSGENFGRTLISITNTEAYNVNQAITVIVEVKPIHYMMISLKSVLRIRPSEELNMLPKGMELEYVFEYFDNVGTKFHAAEVSAKTVVNRADLMSFSKTDDNVVTAKFIENGELVVKAYNEKHPNAMFDYVHMMIGDIIFPTKTTLTVGDIVCFSMPLLSSDGDPGYWQSSVPEVLVIDPITGIGRAKNFGHTVVKHSLTTHMQGEIEVIVQPIAKVSIVPLRGRNITGTETFSVPLVLKSRDEQVKENNVLSRGLGGCRMQSNFALTAFPYTCNIQFLWPSSSIGVKDLFLVKPRFDIMTGFYYCDIIPIGSLTGVSSTLETRIQISAQSKDIEAAPLEVTYLPPVYVDAKEVVFINTHTNVVPTATIYVYGLQAVLDHLTIEVPDGVTVGARQYKSTLLYKLRLMHNQDEIQGQKVIIANDLTKQNISLLVRVAKYENFIPLSGIHWVDYMYFHRYTFGTFAVILISFFYLWKNNMVFPGSYPRQLRKPTRQFDMTCNESPSIFTRSPLRT